MSTKPGRISYLPGRVGRARLTLSQLWQVPIFFIGLFALIAVAASAPMRQNGPTHLMVEQLDTLRELVDHPDEKKFDLLLALVDNVLASLDQVPSRSAEAHFLVGSAYFRIAERAKPSSIDEAKVASYRGKAIEQLQKVHQQEIAQRDTAPLRFRLGLSLYRLAVTDAETQQAIDLLANSIDKGADVPSAAYGVLVEAYLRMKSANVDAALAACDRQLELTDDRAIETMAHVRLTHAELRLRKEQRLEALKELEHIGPAVSREVRLQARLLQTRICESEGLWAKAIPIWNELLKEGATIPGGEGRIYFALGNCQSNLDPPHLEEARVAWQRAVATGGLEAQAAALRLGDLLINGAAADTTAAIDLWTEALAPLRTFSDYNNPYVNIEDLREMFEEAWASFFDAKDFVRSQQIIRLYEKVALPGVALQPLAETAEAFAKDLQTRAGDDPQSGIDSAAISSQFQQAAQAYRDAAAQPEPEGHSDLYWKSAQCYRAANDFSGAVEALESFVKYEKDETKLAEGWLTLAETLLSRKDRPKARLAYYKCIEYPNTPFACRARYQLALYEIDDKNYKQAFEILNQNLTYVGQRLDREAHEKSLYKTAVPLLQMREYDKATLYLKEAIRLYPQNSGVYLARDALGECYNQLAKAAALKSQEPIGEEEKGYHRHVQQQFLQDAAVTFQNLADDLELHSRQRHLTPSEIAIVRKASLMSAEDQLEMNNFTEALRLYQKIQTEHPKQIESLFACWGIWRCVRVIAEPGESQRARDIARASVKVALSDLEEMPAEHRDFQGGNGVLSKAQWAMQLQEIIAGLDRMALPAVR